MRLTLRSQAAFPGRPRPTGMVNRQQDRGMDASADPLLEVPMKAVHWEPGEGKNAMGKEQNDMTKEVVGHESVGENTGRKRTDLEASSGATRPNGHGRRRYSSFGHTTIIHNAGAYAT